jgi:L-rhamnose isomerase
VIRSVVTIPMARAKALLVGRDELEESRQTGDVALGTAVEES